MFRRAATILFLFAITSSVWAETCVCFPSFKTEDNCCRRKTSERPALEGKGCCGENTCGVANQADPASVSDSSASKGYSSVQPLPNHQPTPYRVEIRALPIFVRSAFVDHRLRYARPPNLYVRYSSFLI